MSRAAKARYCSVMMRGRLPLPFSPKGCCHFVSSIQTSSFLQINFKILLFWIEILRRRWLRQPLEFYLASKNVKGRWIRCTNCRNKTPGYRICLPGPRPQAETTCNRFSTGTCGWLTTTATTISYWCCYCFLFRVEATDQILYGPQHKTVQKHSSAAARRTAMAVRITMVIHGSTYYYGNMLVRITVVIYRSTMVVRITIGIYRQTAREGRLRTEAK